ncbi:NTP transferase domain-containing protein [Peribacillus asahii]
MSKIGAVILAAGMSKRMGKPKLLLPLHFIMCLKRLFIIP